MTHSKELNERSPLRVFERSIHGGVGEGKVGVVCAGPGVGKTAFLVGIALDYLMRGHQVLHVAQGFEYDIVPAAQLGWKRVWINRGGRHAGAPVSSRAKRR